MPRPVKGIVSAKVFQTVFTYKVRTRPTNSACLIHSAVGNLRLFFCEPNRDKATATVTYSKIYHS